MQKRKVDLGIAILVAVFLGGRICYGTGGRGQTVSAAVQQDPTPTPTGMPAMDMSGMNMPDASGTVTDTMSGMDMTAHDMTGHDTAGRTCPA